ncbi:BON domain-containing protein [Novosphingobium huizhouense]|uniref:BON domain-containing protein n=1 Tax=Novosphingobium huizhouense TaxID=2866625 RepID=UPI001CD90B4E|nr:BON domain-containing protein [Novosphingobium huizhouense]
MTDRYDWERDEALKRDRDPRNMRSNDYSGQQYGGSRQRWDADERAEERASAANRYGHGYDNRDDYRSDFGHRDRDRDREREQDNRRRQGGGRMGGFGSEYYGGSQGGGGQTGDYFGPGDFGSGSHAYAANWDRGYGASRTSYPGERDQTGYGGRGGYGARQATQRQGGMRQMGGGSSSYQPGEGYAREDMHRGFLDRAADEVMSWWGDEDAARRREQDAREDHRGRGPSDYTRSDERIREDANDRLTDDWRVDARRISVAVENGEVTLTGTVGNRQEKHRAEECVERVSGVKHVQNNLRVEGTGTGTGSGASGGASTASTSQGSAFGYRSELDRDAAEKRTGATAGTTGSSATTPEKRD